MAASLTLHSMDANLSAALRARAKEVGKSLNQTAQELLASALGLFSVKPPANDLGDCFGLIDAADATELLKSVKEQDVIDEDIWK